MNSLKTLCVMIVLSAVGYGAYVTLTGSPPSEPPPEAAGWDMHGIEGGPAVEIPTGQASTPPGITVPAPSGPLVAAQSSAPPPGLIAPPGGTGPTLGAGPAMTLPPEPEDGTSISSASPAEPFPPSAPTGSSAAPPFIQPTIGPPPGTEQSGTAPTGGQPLLTQPTVDSSVDKGGPMATAIGIDTVAPFEPDPTAEFQTAMNTSQSQLNEGHLAEALLTLSPWYGNTRLPPADYARLTDLLDQVAGTVIYSRQHLLEPPYSVQPGDTLERIAERYDVPWQLLAKINGIADPQQVRPGDQLKVVRGPFDAVVNLSNFELTLMLRGRYAGRFKVGIGQDQSTPEGEFMVKNKVNNPTYYGPATVVAADDPGNPLGERWIGLDSGNQLGIHGTNDPASIGRAESRGCIRLSPTDVEDVYDILSIGSKVVIRR